MTAEELDRLAELEAKATKGPWVWQNYGKKPEPYIICQTCCYPSPRTTVAWGNYTGGQGWPAVGDSGVFDRESVEANAALIAALRNAAPSLIALAEWAEKAKATFNTLSNVSHSEQLVVEICEAAIQAYPEGE